MIFPIKGLIPRFTIRHAPCNAGSCTPTTMPPIRRHGSYPKRWLAPWAAIAIVIAPTFARAERPLVDPDPHGPTASHDAIQPPGKPGPSSLVAGLSLGLHSVNRQGAAMLGGVVLYSVAAWLRVGAAGYMSVATFPPTDMSCHQCLNSVLKIGSVVELHANANAFVDPWFGIEGGWLASTTRTDDSSSSTGNRKESQSYGYFRGSFGLDLQAVRGSTNFSFGPELGYIVEKHNGLMAGVRVTLGWL
ncbi:MAG: hypothetical protein HY898_00485 [Deltaproteobacteria bacterium]|nr:hypothetical protein [Deltaproteobacteria bacterium]